MSEVHISAERDGSSQDGEEGEALLFCGGAQGNLMEKAGLKIQRDLLRATGSSDHQERQLPVMTQPG